jgi:Holliday junction DNA helicase RuvA
MIAFINGILQHKTPTEVVVDVHGIGYAVHIPLSTYTKLGDVGRPISLFTHMHMREDAMQLFGFATLEERQWFRLLLSVSGIGPRLAQGILSGIDVQELHAHIAQGEAAALTSIPGIGKKTAERLIVELRDKASKISLEGSAGAMTGASSSAVRSEALQALLSLGFTQQAAEKSIHAASSESNPASSVEELIKSALRHAGKK